MIYKLLILFGVLFAGNLYPMQFEYTGGNATLIRKDSSGNEITVVVPQARRNRSFALTSRDVKRVLDGLTPEERPIKR